MPLTPSLSRQGRGEIKEPLRQFFGDFFEQGVEEVFFRDFAEGACPRGNEGYTLRGTIQWPIA